ncbi:hypothetical protein A3715_12750 [Oleiphilus sp. HI0009]|uniref:DUF1852 domain-containing protein n=1 Tax=unclassified Oleiphilus TaxID=2631174 RepID=UPI0007C245FA|nr:MULTISPECIES: DUF1852 domain-containing protein [unclassified Oleiphilus]KZX76653.1 hypothetical protein A3715_12750 [Oleiphilus sp. HI0009]KZY65395.1 hypothetical protein A3738_01110 [Oleiphilus sp. HI0066]KZY68514.1 hypothetical protein A3739_01395 [Oleiphilus sp. HI0067]MCH2158922.1 DUF1852 domain-containing protein [Oleiphilaceae bacterium]
MSKGFTYTIKTIQFDEHYRPSDGTRITTNFANLARGESRKENLRNALRMVDSRFNALANWDNPKGDRYSVDLEIVSVDMDIEGNGEKFPSIEILKTYVVDRLTNKRIEGIVGNNFSSYVRDYDFSVLLLDHNKDQDHFSIPDNFGDLHGNLFKDFICSDTYKKNFNKLPVICLSVSDNKIYQRTENGHPVLGIEYLPNESSLTEQYFKKMGFEVRYFMPPNSVAPLAFYFFGDLLSDYTNLELISTISTMETFQKIYRPEIYNANAVAGNHYQPKLKHSDHSLTQIVYDRQERSQLAIKQGKFAEENFIKPYQNVLEKWSANFSPSNDVLQNLAS